MNKNEEKVETDKEKAKAKFARWFNPEKLPNRDLIVNHVNFLIDAIEPESNPVILPKSVGDWIDHCTHDMISISDALNHNSSEHSAIGYEMPVKVIKWLYDREHQLLFARGYLYGWTPEPVQRYLLPLVGTEDSEVCLYAYRGDESWLVEAAKSDSEAVAKKMTVTQDDLEDAPAWVQAIEKQEVKSND